MPWFIPQSPGVVKVDKAYKNGLLSIVLRPLSKVLSRGGGVVTSSPSGSR